MASSSSSVGFQHGVIYKIINPKDKYSVEIANASVEPGAKVIATKRWRDVPSHKFKTEQVEDAPGEFRVSSVLQPRDGDQLVWDFIPNEGLVIHNTAGGSINQIWLTEGVPNRNNIYFIKTKEGLCLRNMGKNKQLGLVHQDPKDSRQHWRLEQKTSY